MGEQVNLLQIVNALCDGLLVAALGGVIWLIRTVTRLESDVSWIKQSMIYMGKSAGMRTHSPHTPEFDEMLRRFWRNEMTAKEVHPFIEKLKHAANDTTRDNAHKQFAVQALSAVSLEFKIPMRHVMEGITIE